jgi:hypothetical protein
MYAAAFRRGGTIRVLPDYEERLVPLRKVTGVLIDRRPYHSSFWKPNPCTIPMYNCLLATSLPSMLQCISSLRSSWPNSFSVYCITVLALDANRLQMDKRGHDVVPLLKVLSICVTPLDQPGTHDESHNSFVDFITIRAGYT